jgi:hypothetical protein
VAEPREGWDARLATTVIYGPRAKVIYRKLVRERRLQCLRQSKL